MPVKLIELGTRIRGMREVLSYSLAEASQATGISQDRLNSIEAGSLEPTGDEVLILASFFECDFKLLVDSSQPRPNGPAEILFRRYGESFTSQDRRAIQEFIHLCQIEESIELLVGTTKRPFSFVPIGNYRKAHGQEGARALRTFLGHSDNLVPYNIYADFRKIGVHVFRRKLANPEISGLYVHDPIAGNCVLVNYHEDIYRQRFSVAHEVAHAIFDSSDAAVVSYERTSGRYDKNDLQEIRANSFASQYLMPVEMLRKVQVTASNALDWAQKFRVSTSALAKALLDANLVSREQAGVIKSSRVPSLLKIDPEAPNELSEAQQERRLALLERGLSDYFVRLCFEAHYSGHISTGRLREALRVDYSELKDLAELYGTQLTHVF